MFKRKLKICLVVLSLTFVSPANALPVLDIPVTVQNIINVAIGYTKQAYQAIIKTKAVRTLTETIKIYNNAKKHYEDITGNFGYASVMGLMQDRELREYTPENWNDTVDAVNGANNSVWTTYSRLQSAASSFENGNVPYLKNVVYADPNTLSAKKYKETFQTNKAYDVVVTTSLNQVQERIEKTQKIVDEIDSAETPSKKDDLRNVLIAENAMLQQETIRLTALTVKRENDTKIEEMQRRAEDVKYYEKKHTNNWSTF